MADTRDTFLLWGPNLSSISKIVFNFFYKYTNQEYRCIVVHGSTVASLCHFTFSASSHHVKSQSKIIFTTHIRMLWGGNIFSLFVSLGGVLIRITGLKSFPGEKVPLLSSPMGVPSGKGSGNREGANPVSDPGYLGQDWAHGQIRRGQYATCGIPHNFLVTNMNQQGTSKAHD